MFCTLYYILGTPNWVPKYTLVGKIDLTLVLMDLTVMLGRKTLTILSYKYVIMNQ